MEQFDYIVAGGGLAGLSLLVTLIDEHLLDGKRVLLLENQLASRSERTWCYWDREDASGSFPAMLSCHFWKAGSFSSKSFSLPFDLFPLQYYCVTGADFYAYALEKISAHPEIQIKNESVKSLKNEGDHVLVTAGNTYRANWAFSSILPRALAEQAGRHYLLQHFKGWWVNMDEPVFDDKTASLFDFNCLPNSADPLGGNTFVYILPLDSKFALVEYTIFSASLARKEEYDAGLSEYLSVRYPGKSYSIKSTEEGLIPMTNHNFVQQKGQIVYLGTAGGQTKPSSGFTFKFVQKHSERIAWALKSSGKPVVIPYKSSRRFSFYDSVFLRILKEGSLSAEEIFARLFSRNPAALVFRFLDNDTSLAEEIKLMRSLQIGVFTLAAVKELTGRYAS